MSESGERAADQGMLGGDPVATARDLTDALTGMTAQLRDAQAAIRLGRRVLIVVSAGLVLDVVLTIVLGLVAGQSHDASAQAQGAAARANAAVAQLHATQVSSCEDGNQTRAGEIALWEHIYGLSVAAAKPTAAERQADERLLAYVRATFAPRDCARLYHLGAASGR
jgi:hypothetical protein